MTDANHTPTDDAATRVTSFLNANYPCRCKDDECPGNSFEANEIVRIVQETLIPDAAAEINQLRQDLATALTVR